MKSFNLKGSVAVVGALALMANSLSASAAVTGHFDVVSKYVLRGITTTYGTTAPVSGTASGNAAGDAPESEKPSLQGGLDYSDDSGFYLGYAFATIGYSYADGTLGDKAASIEHDTYGGYAGKVGDIGYKVGLLHLNYVPQADAVGTEALLGVSYKEFGFNVQPFLNDTTYANKGDTYITATYATKLPMDIGFNASLGYYKYTKSGEFINKDGASTLAKDMAFRHLILGVSYPFTKNVNAAASYIIGGENRWGVKQDNMLVGSVSYTF
ncbi:MAG: hypothetical protein B7Y56_03905 [Gallionellales bacterium 35-53-114]|jgi:uncharacterized protein (TIGR02001 family)|nr:MAG: hypothetical protein B7Y56_03905 [Gallionellales bacterium 35-53-114]OYZ65243.1 MAG: hypothetical protein B7Y04_01065 [Gallionellales bacterium 24-53-125]OZB08149.1 MAG: hypothetical protein B7X61_11515 [Gallionellales bacterium 39-52-133]HQS58074.1 TorF family putative porin [Gallionellaceae bacterium]HQS73629.1 TorF family putative porin [Gallionellaceae bacterium]